MTIDTVNEIWQELKRYIGPTDRPEAADMLVNILIDNDYDAADIRDAFKGDPDVRHSLQTYLLEDEESEEEEDFDDLFDDR